MNKLIISLSVLQSALGWVLPAKKESGEFHEVVHFDLVNHALTLTTTKDDSRFEDKRTLSATIHRVESNPDSRFSFFIPFAGLSKLLKLEDQPIVIELREKLVLFSTTEDTIEIGTSEGFALLEARQTQIGEETFVLHPEIKNELPGLEIYQSPDPHKPHLRGVNFLSRGGKLTLAASDGMKLHTIELNGCAEEFNFLLPAPVVSLLAKSKKLSEGVISGVLFRGNNERLVQLSMQGRHVSFRVETVCGSEFPDTAKVLTSSKNYLEIDTDELLSAMEIGNKLCYQDHQQLIMSPLSTELRVENPYGALLYTRTLTRSTYKGADKTIMMSRSLFEPLLKERGRIRMEFADKSLVAVVRRGNKSWAMALVDMNAYA